MRWPVIEYRISVGDHSTRRTRLDPVRLEKRDIGLGMHEGNSENRNSMAEERRGTKE